MKYIVLTDTRINLGGDGLFRVQALKDFADVKKGDIGGYINNVHNLSQDGDCWVYDNAKVYEAAEVRGNARVCNLAQVYGSVVMCENSCVCGKSQVYGNVRLDGDIVVEGFEIISDMSRIIKKKEPTKAQMRENTIDEAYKIDNLEIVIYDKDKMINDVVAEILFHNVNEQYKQVIGYWLNSDISKFILHTDLEIDTDEVDWYDLKELIVYGINYLSDMEKKEDMDGLAYIESIKNEVKRLIPQVESIVAIGSCIDNLNNILNDLKQIVEE
jgi:hypothetical protein